MRLSSQRTRSTMAWCSQICSISQTKKKLEINPCCMLETNSMTVGTYHFVFHVSINALWQDASKTKVKQGKKELHAQDFSICRTLDDNTHLPTDALSLAVPSLPWPSRSSLSLGVPSRAELPPCGEPCRSSLSLGDPSRDGHPPCGEPPRPPSLGVPSQDGHPPCGEPPRLPSLGVPSRAELPPCGEHPRGRWDVDVNQTVVGHKARSMKITEIHRQTTMGTKILA